VFIPLATARRMQTLWGMFVIAASRTPELSEEAKAEITFFLRRKRQISPGQPDNFHVEAIDKYVQQFKSVAATITMVATGVVGISLLVGGVGIMNIMLVSVSERTREIGLRKAVGARPSAVLLQFLIEAVMLCCFGGLIGLLAGKGLTSLLASIPQAKLDKAYIPGWAVALSFGFAASVGLIFGMFPAIKAARLDPIEALRHE
jgi:putative ABC transport system permease protein